MTPATMTKLRNALAQVAAEWLAEPTSRTVAAAHALPFSSMTEDDWREAVRLWRLHASELLAEVPARGCPACGSAQSRLLFESYDLHPYHECDDCGCWFVPKSVDWPVFDRLFARSPEAAALASRMMNARDAEAGREADMARIGGYLDELLPMLQPLANGPLAYLDTGCGVGHSLRAGLARGLRVQGVEVDTTALELARADGLPVVTPDEPVPPGPYNLLSFWETLEHIADPLPALERYLPLLAEDGLVAITVPNLNALATRAMRESCPWIHGGYNTPGHVNMFHVRSIERLLARAGLTMLDADGQFSANPVELFATLSGESRGAFDNLDPALQRGTMPANVSALLEGVWPGAALIERLALASPILQVVACRRGREARFQAAIDARRRRRAAEIAAESELLLSAETDYKAMAAGLQGEVDRRDELLRNMMTTMQNEVDRRQVEIDLRDKLLDDVRVELARTVDERIRSALRAVRRRMAR